MPLSSSSAKAQGEEVEVRFLLQALTLGLAVAKPYGDNVPYDFIVDNGRRTFRVQVKSVSRFDLGSYRLSTARGGRGKSPYSPREIDFLAAYIIPEDAWYLIPVRAFAPRKSLRLCPANGRPGSRPRRLERYREAWHLLTR